MLGRGRALAWSGPLRERPAIGKSRCEPVGTTHTESMSTDKLPRGVASAYFEASKAHDIERVRLHMDIDFVGASASHWVAEILSGLGGMFAITR